MKRVEIYKLVPASEWSGLSTKKQVDLARKHGVIVVTWHGDPAMVVRDIESDPEVFVDDDE